MLRMCMRVLLGKIDGAALRYVRVCGVLVVKIRLVYLCDICWLHMCIEQPFCSIRLYTVGVSSHEICCVTARNCVFTAMKVSSDQPVHACLYRNVSLSGRSTKELK